MARRDGYAESWKAMEKDLRTALSEVSLGSAATALIVEFLDHNELGLAFSTLVEALDQQPSTPSPRTIERLSAAYERMGRPEDGAEAWARLAQPFRQ